MQLKQYNFPELTSIQSVFEKKYEQIVGKKSNISLEVSINNIEEPRKQQLMFMKTTLDYMVEQLKQHGYDEKRMRGFSLVYTGINEAVVNLARAGNWSNNSEFSDRLDEVVGKVKYSKEGQKIKVKLAQTDLVNCLSAAEAFLIFIICKEGKIEKGMKDEHMYNKCDCKLFNTIKVFNKVVELLKNAKKEAVNIINEDKIMKQELENGKTSSSGIFGWMIGGNKKKEPSKNIILSNDEFQEEPIEFVENTNETGGFSPNSFGFGN